MTVLPLNILRCLSDEDRKSLGKAGLLPEEALKKAVAKNERQLQGLIVNLLRLRGIEPLWFRTDRKSAATVGWPDVTFTAIGDWQNIDRDLEGTFTTACAWEVKFGDGQLSKEQQQMHIRLSTPPNAWRIKVIRSVDEALSELKELGL